MRRAGCLIPVPPLWFKGLHRPVMPLCPDADPRLWRRRVAATGNCSCCVRVCACVGYNEWAPETDTVTKIEREKWERRRDKACVTNSFIAFEAVELLWRLSQRAVSCLLCGRLCVCWHLLEVCLTDGDPLLWGLCCISQWLEIWQMPWPTAANSDRFHLYIELQYGNVCVWEDKEFS